MISRIAGFVVFGIIGLFLGAGTGIVGGIFGAKAGAGIFGVIGAIYGLSAGPDALKLISWFRSKVNM